MASVADNQLVARGFTGRWSELAPLNAPAAAAFFVADHAAAARVVWAHASGSRESLVAAASREEPSLVADISDSGLAVVRVGPNGVVAEPTARPRRADEGRLWLLTSGSTGRPKRVAHTLDSLTTVRGEQPPRTWLCPYTPGAYAWWQVVTLSLRIPGQDVVFVEPDEVEDWANLALEHGVSAASGTPTFWRQSLMRSGQTLAKVQLKQVTLGGEPVDQGILDTLRDAFPAARISWIYASSEAGAAIAVHDGRAGFPAEWLERESPERPRMIVDDGELLIASPYRAEGIDPVLHTGDRAEIRDGRVLITGRIASDEINVGGSKVSASHVREVILSHPGVVWASVQGRKAPLVGTVVTAKVVLADESVSVTELSQYCAAHLADYAVPRRMRILDSIPLRESLKSDV